MFEEVLEAVTNPATAPPPHIALLAETVTRRILADIETDAERWPSALTRIDDSIAAAERRGQSDVLVNALSKRPLVYFRLGEKDRARADLAKLETLLDQDEQRAPRFDLLRARLAEVALLLAD